MFVNQKVRLMKKNDSLADRHSGAFSSAAGHRKFTLCALLACVLPLALATGAELKQARVTQVVRDVKLLPGQAAPRPAAISDQVREGTAVRTGEESRAELTLTDQTHTRRGANTRSLISVWPSLLWTGSSPAPT